MDRLVFLVFFIKIALAKTSYPRSSIDGPPPTEAPPPPVVGYTPPKAPTPVYSPYLQAVFNNPSPKDDGLPFPSNEIDTMRMVGNLSSNLLSQVNRELNKLDPRKTSTQNYYRQSNYGPNSYGSTGHDSKLPSDLFISNNYGQNNDKKLYDENDGYDDPKRDISLDDLSHKDQYKLEQYIAERKNSKNVAIGLGVGIPCATIVLIIIVVFCFRHMRRRRENGLPSMPVPKFTDNNYEKYQHSPALSSFSSDPWELSRSNLIIDYENKLGSGAFCNVFAGKVMGEAPVFQMLPSLRSSQFRDCEVAVKMLPSFADDIARSDFMQEINFMKSLKYHPHLVSMLGWVADRKSPLLLVEYCTHGDLLHFIRERKDFIRQGSQNPSGLSVKQVVSFGWQISNGLEYLNSIGCIHRDIAARNVLIDQNLTCKIGDFGLCRLTDSLLYTARGGRLPLKWMAIESLATFEYTFKSDVWSFGVLLWELLSLGEVPFVDIQTTDLLDHLKMGHRLVRPELCTNEVYDVMSSCWLEDAQSRPSFTLICSIFSKILEKATENYGYLRPTRDSVEYDNV